jgi:tRNA-binding protein
MSPVPVKALIDLSVLEQVDVRVGTIESVCAIEGATRVIKLRVDFGDHMRTIVAGNPATLVTPWPFDTCISI